MNLYKELFDFLEANNWLSLEDEENAKGVIASYIKAYKPELQQGQSFTDTKIPLNQPVKDEFPPEGCAFCSPLTVVDYDGKWWCNDCDKYISTKD